MLTRYRWYRIQLPKGVPSLIKLIADHPMSQDASFGFVETEDALGVLKYRFIWRTNVVVTRFDEEGTPTYEDIASICFTEFAIIHLEGHIILRVENPGRNIRDLLNALESLIGLGFTSKALSFDRVKPTSVFELIETTKIVGLKVVGAVINEDLVARMEFASKQGIQIEKLKALQNIKYKVDSVAYELLHEGIRGQLAIASSGLVKIGGQLAPRLIQLVEQDLPKCI